MSPGTAPMFLRTFAAVFVATFVLTACQEPAAPPEAPAPAPAPAAEPAPAPAVPPAGDVDMRFGLRWSLAADGEAPTLTLNDARDRAMLHVACLQAPARLRVRVPSFEAIGSEERLSFGIDNDSHILVADPTLPGPGVQAEGAVPDGWFDRLAAANAVSANYGAQDLGPHMPPPPQLAREFAAACGAG